MEANRLNDFNIGCFNLFNLLLPGRPLYGRNGYTKEAYERKISWTARQLDRMEADIVGFQEVFHPEALEAALKKSKKLKNANFVVANPTGELPRVALATNFQINSYQIIEDFPRKLDIEGEVIPLYQFSRPVLKAQVSINQDFSITAYVVHLKSKRPMLQEGEDRKNPLDLAMGQARALIRRAAEATALRELVMHELRHRDHPVILMGDVNDSGLAVTTRIVSGEPPHRRFPHEVKKKIWDVLLYHTKDIQARLSYQDFYYTHIHNGHHEALDHIMVSQELVRDNPKHLASIGYIKILNDHLLDETLTDERVKGWQSDHGQVVATVEMRK